jgi:hypothetical protein
MAGQADSNYSETHMAALYEAEKERFGLNESNGFDIDALTRISDMLEKKIIFALKECGDDEILRDNLIECGDRIVSEWKDLRSQVGWYDDCNTYIDEVVRGSKLIDDYKTLKEGCFEITHCCWK